MRTKAFSFVASVAALLAVGVVAIPQATATGARPALGTGPATIDPATVPGAYRMASGSWAVPLASAKPSWLTPELEAAAKNGKGKPTEAPPAAAAAIPGPPVDAPAAGYVGIRPGTWMVSPAGCTLNYVFGSPGTYSIGTAGHCAKGGTDIIVLTGAPPNQDPCVPLSDICFTTGTPVLVNIGTVAKSVDNGVGDDFAIITVRPELQSWVYTTQAQVLGPCGKYAGDGTAPDVDLPDFNIFGLRGADPLELGETIYHYGHGLAVGTGGTIRAGVATAWYATSYYWAGGVLFGDSGSAARIHDLKAAGDVTHIVVPFLGSRTPGYNAGTRIARMEQIARKPLANSPYCI